MTPTPSARVPPTAADPGPALTGVVLAAGAGRRMGTPKALLRDAEGRPWTVVTARALLCAGCADVLVVLGAAAAEAGRQLSASLEPADAVAAVVAPGWDQGMGVSLRTALERLSEAPGRAAGALVTLVDLPDVGTAVHRRVVEEWRGAGSGSDALVRATYAGRPGHPVLLGRDHWAAVARDLDGDTGAQPYLRRHTVREVSCEDLASGRDVDRPEDLAGPTSPTGGSR